MFFLPSVNCNCKCLFPRNTRRAKSISISLNQNREITETAGGAEERYVIDEVKELKS